jgi:transcriptional regulator with XRE-family HTH domain
LIKFIVKKNIIGYNFAMIKEKIKYLRIKNNLTQKDLGIILNLSQNTISQLESGIFEPNIDTIINISIYFNVTTDYLIL